MSRTPSYLFAFAATVLLGAPRSTRADEVVLLDRAGVIAHAKTTAPSAKITAGNVEEAKAATYGVGVVSLERPTVTFIGGVRSASPESPKRLPELGTTVMFPLDLGGRPSARRAEAGAQLDTAKAEAKDVLRETVREALLRYVRALRSVSLVTITTARRDVSLALVTIAKRRVAAGDVSETDVALAQIELARDEGRLLAVTGEVDTTAIALRTYLGVSASAKITGSLGPPTEPPTLETLLANVDQRSDVRAARAAESSTSASLDLARADRWPTIGLLGSWTYSELAHTYTIGLALPLPLLNGNKTMIATADARVANAKTRAGIVRARAEAEIRAAYQRYTTAKSVVEAFAKATALLDGALDTARKSYDAGKSSLGDVLIVRRSVADARQEKLDADVSLAEAAIELDAASGRLP